MKMEILFAVAAIMLGGAVLVIAFPIPVQAAKTLWCSTTYHATGCFTDKGICEKWRIEHSGVPCQKGPI